jgi:hypothetical protein
MGRVLLALGVAAMLSACAPRALPPPAVKPSADGFAACRDGLAASGALFEVLAPLRTREGCGFEEGVRLTASPSQLNQPATLACPAALALARFDLDVVQPAAQRHFGRGVTRIHHVGGYTCRAVAGTRKWSQHAFGNAIDVIGFDLADGTRISVGRDWRARGPRSAFLQEVARNACRVFTVVLSPAYDRAHQDHLHLDIGPERVCGV